MLTCLTGWAEPLPATTTAKLPRVAASVTYFMLVRDHHVYSPIMIRTAPANHSRLRSAFANMASLLFGAGAHTSLVYAIAFKSLECARELARRTATSA